MRALQRQVRRLQRQVKRVQQERELQAQHLHLLQVLQLLEQQEHPLLLEPQPPVPVPEPTPRALGQPPPLTPEEKAELEPMPDPMEEIEHRLGLSITPPSQQTWAG